SISYFPSPSEIAPTGQVSLQLPQLMQSPPITYAMGNTSIENFLFPGTVFSIPDRLPPAVPVGCPMPILPQTLKKARGYLSPGTKNLRYFIPPAVVVPPPGQMVFSRPYVWNGYAAELPGQVWNPLILWSPGLPS